MIDRQRKLRLLAGRLRSIGFSPVLLVAVLIGGDTSRLEAAMVASVVPGIASPAPVGTPVTWSAQIEGASPANLWYRFRVREEGGEFRIIRDYSPRDWLIWTSLD